jgi:hypothetical protein
LDVSELKLGTPRNQAALLPVSSFRPRRWPPKTELSHGPRLPVRFPCGKDVGARIVPGVAAGAATGLKALPLFRIAFKMLVGNRGKYIGMVLGITFVALLIGHQSGVFCGIMWLTTSQIRDVQDADIWVMDGNVEYIDDIKPLRETDLYRVRGASGIG